MKTVLFYFVTVIFLLTLSSCNQKPPELDFPSYEKVVNKFAKKYRLETEDNGYIVFQKCPEGWYVAIKKYIPVEKIIKRKLYWDVESGEFENIHFDKLDKGEENNEIILNRLLDKQEIASFELNPYYGYCRYEKDIIDFYKKYRKLNDDQLYSLGRAYDNYANKLLFNQSALCDLDEQFDLKLKKNSMTKEQLTTYINYKKKAFQTLNKLAQRNPEYPTYIGSIRNKIANDYMNAYIQIWAFQNVDEANTYISDMPEYYSDLMLSHARNYLQSCEKNAILFTSGDNDTYPLLYVQAKENLRPDVQVINTNLLYIDRYIYSLNDMHFKSNPLKLAIKPDDYKDDKLDIVVIEKNYTGQPASINELIEFVTDESNKKTYSSMEYPYLPTADYSISSSDSTTITARLYGSALYKNELILLDIISNNAERPVYFTSQSYLSYLGLQEYSNQEGIVYKLCFSPDEIDPAKSYENMTKNYDLTWTKNISNDEKSIASNYRYHFGLLGNTLVKVNRLDSARSILKKGMELFPDKTIPFDLGMSSYILAYYEMGEFEKGDEIARTYMDNLNNGKHNQNDYAKEHLDPASDFDRQKTMINNILRHYQRPALEVKDKKSIKDLL